MFSQAAERHPKDESGPESGYALVSVLMVLIIVSALSAVMFANARFETRSTGNARDFEAALHSAEAGLEAVFTRILAGENLPAVDWQGPDPGTDPAGERLEVIRVIADTDGDVFAVETGGVSAFGIGPVEAESGDQFVYGVAAVAASTAADPEYRIVRTRLADMEVEPEVVEDGGSHISFGDKAVHVNGDLTLSGNVTQMTGNLVVHGSASVRNAFGQLLRASSPKRTISTLTGNVNPALSGGTPGDLTCTDSFCPEFRHTDHQAGSPFNQIGKVEVEATPPVLNARDVHRRYAAEIGEKAGVGDWYDLCYPDAAAGRTHPSVHRAPTTPGAEPCTGEKIREITTQHPNAYRGWQYSGNTWTKSSGTDGYPEDGVYYAHERNILTSDLGNQSRRITLIASADVGDASSSFGSKSGNIYWQGSSVNKHYDRLPGFELALFADRDLDGSTGFGQAAGVVYAREQARSSGNSQVWGQVIAAGAPIGPVAPGTRSSPGSPVGANGAVWGGTIRIDYVTSGFEVTPVEVDDPINEPGPPERITVRTWDEL